MRLSKSLFLCIIVGLLTLALLAVTAHSHAFGTPEPVTPVATPTPSESVLWNFDDSNHNDGTDPAADLISDASGNLYGTTDVGGDNAGTVFELTPPSTSGGSWGELILWNFGSYVGDGEAPKAGLIMDKNGDLYGTTEAGGVGDGTVFELTPPSSPGSKWNESILYNFGHDESGTAPDGADPFADLIMDTSGNLYGTTQEGGTHYTPNSPFGGGTAFELVRPSTTGGDWTETVLWSFGNGTDGADPRAGLIMDKSGNLYGTTQEGGAYGGEGTAFKLIPPSTSGGNWSESVLWSFGNGIDGFMPDAGLIVDKIGDLFGTTSSGSAGEGTVFELIPPSTTGDKWGESILWNFGGSPDGSIPLAGLLMDKSGNLYGTTKEGGELAGFGGFGFGAVFKLRSPRPVEGIGPSQSSGLSATAVTVNIPLPV